MGGPRREKLPQLLLNWEPLRTPLPSLGLGTPPALGEEGGSEGGFPRPPWQAPEPAPEPAVAQAGLLCAGGAVGGRGARDGHRAPLCAAASGAGCGIGTSRGDGELLPRDEERAARDGERDRGWRAAACRVEGGAGRCVRRAEALCKHVNLFSFLPRLSG